MSEDNVRMQIGWPWVVIGADAGGTGVDRVFVNGVEVVRHGRHTGATPGRVLRESGATPR